MQISFSPIRHDTKLTASLKGEVLTLNGQALDLSATPSTGALSREGLACDWLGSDVVREGGVLCLTLLLPHGPNALDKTRFPAPITVARDGKIRLPAYD